MSAASEIDLFEGDAVIISRKRGERWASKKSVAPNNSADTCEMFDLCGESKMSEFGNQERWLPVWRNNARPRVRGSERPANSQIGQSASAVVGPCQVSFMVWSRFHCSRGISFSWLGPAEHEIHQPTHIMCALTCLTSRTSKNEVNRKPAMRSCRGRNTVYGIQLMIDNEF